MAIITRDVILPGVVGGRQNKLNPYLDGDLYPYEEYTLYEEITSPLPDTFVVALTADEAAIDQAIADGAAWPYPLE